jgi:D-beta-D-heptose 7-phosphate kinase/D-beta-D-heptose 1-phosphate adenosyltransferase
MLRAEMLAAPGRYRGTTLGVVSGAFDLLHLGHIRGIAFARSFLEQRPNPKLCAMTLSDEHIRAKKGPGRPILNLSERLDMLSHIRHVDYVLSLEAPDCLSALGQLRPDFFFKDAGDRAQSIVGQEMELVESVGGKVVLFPESTRVTSTSELVETIARREEKGYGSRD